MDEVNTILEKLEKDDPREGIELAEKYISDEDPDDEAKAKLTYGVAAGKFKLGQFEEAIDWLEKSTSDRRWMLKGFCELQLQKPGDASESFKRSAEDYTENKDEALLMSAQSQTLKEDFSSARSEFEELLKKDLDGDFRAEVLLNRGLVEVESEEYRDARSWLQQVIDEHEESPFALQAAFHLVTVLEQLGLIESAIKFVDWLDERVEDDAQQEDVDNLRQRLQKNKKDRASQLKEYEF